MRTNFTCGEMYEAFQGSETYSRFSSFHQKKAAIYGKPSKDAWCTDEAGVYVVPEGKKRAINLLACGIMITLDRPEDHANGQTIL